MVYKDSERWYGNFTTTRFGGIAPAEEKIEETRFSQCDEGYDLRFKVQSEHESLSNLAELETLERHHNILKISCSQRKEWGT